MGSSQSFSHLRWNTHHPLPSLSHLGNSLNCPFHVKEVNSRMVLDYVCPVLGVCLDFVCKHTTCALCKHWYTMWIPFSDQLKGDAIFSLKWYTERDGLQLHVVLLFSFWFCLSWCIYLSFPWVVIGEIHNLFLSFCLSWCIFMDLALSFSYFVAQEKFPLKSLLLKSWMRLVVLSHWGL